MLPAVQPSPNFAMAASPTNPAGLGQPGMTDSLRLLHASSNTANGGLPPCTDFKKQLHRATQAFDVFLHRFEAPAGTAPASLGKKAPPGLARHLQYWKNARADMQAAQQPLNASPWNAPRPFQTCQKLESTASRWATRFETRVEPLLALYERFLSAEAQFRQMPAHHPAKKIIAMALAHMETLMQHSAASLSTATALFSTHAQHGPEDTANVVALFNQVTTADQAAEASLHQHMQMGLEALRRASGHRDALQALAKAPEINTLLEDLLSVYKKQLSTYKRQLNPGLVQPPRVGRAL
jgi:hypothetical protein